MRALLRGKPEPPNSDVVWATWLQSLDEKPAAPRLDFDRKARSGVSDANARTVNAHPTLCANAAADPRTGDALRNRSRIRRHQQCGYGDGPGQPNHTPGAEDGSCCL